MKNNWDKLLIAILLLLSVLTFNSLLREGYFPMHDDMQAMRLLQLDKCVKDFQIPCRWVPDMGYGYGYPQFNFYSPLPYYVMEIFNLIGFSILASVKIGFIIPVFMAGIGMYLLGRELWGRAGGFLSAFLFVFAPYRAVEMYVRGAMGELWALSILPWIFLSLFLVLKKQKHSVLILSLSLATLFLSHNVTTLITFPFVVLYILFLIFNKYNFNITSLLENKKNLILFFKNLFLSLVWGLGIAAFFLFPAILEQQYVHIETLVGGYFDYRIHFVNIKQLVFPIFWEYGSSEANAYDMIYLGVGPILIFLAIFSIIAAFIKNYKNNKNIFLAGFAGQALLINILAFFALFLIHSKSAFIWERLEFQSVFNIEIIQFPWRFLSIATFFFALAAGGFTKSFEKTKKTLIIIFIIIFTVLSYSWFFKPQKWIDINDSQKFSGENWRLQQTISIFDYLPIYAEFPPTSRAPVLPNSKKGTNWMKLTVNSKEPETIELPLYYFPGWKVWVDNKQVEISYDNELGLINFDVAAGEHEIYAKLTDTPVRRISNIISLFSILLVFIYAIRFRHRTVIPA